MRLSLAHLRKRVIIKKRLAKLSSQAVPFLLLAAFLWAVLGAASGVGHAKIAPFKTPAPSPHGKGPDKRLSKGKFLVASRSIGDQRFAETVILLVDYGSHGAVGIIINRPTKVGISEALPHITELKDRKERLYFGGPVEADKMLMLVRSADKPGDSLHVFSDIYVSSNADLLRGIINEKAAAESFRVFAGYAGWAPGQLETELSAGAWEVKDASPDKVFDKNPADLWQTLTRKGVET